MKKIILILICSIVLFSSLVPLSYAEETTIPNLVRFHFPEPDVPWFATYNRLFTIRCTTPLNGLTMTGSFDPDGNWINLKSSNENIHTLTFDSSNNRVYFWLYNFYNVDITYIYNSYDLNGNLIRSFSIQVPANGTSHPYLTLAGVPDGYAYSADTMIPDDTFKNFPKLPISFANDIDYTNDFIRIENSLNTIINSCSQLINQDANYYDVIKQFLDDFFLTDYSDSDIGNNWSYYLTKIQDLHYTIYTFETDFNHWYKTYYNPKTDQTNQILQDIYAILGGGQVITTVPPEESLSNEVSSYHDIENSLVEQFSRNEVESQFNQANEIFGSSTWSIGPAFNFVMSQINWFFSSFTIIKVIVLFALSFGLVILILGRKVS